MATLYEQFRASFDVREGADYAIIENVCGNERDQLEDDLIAHLDFFEIHALGMLQSAKAVPALKNLRLASDTRIAKALWDIEQFADAPPIIAAVLASDVKSTDWSVRTDAAIALRGIDHSDANAALEIALFDDDYLVRYHSAHSLAANRNREITDSKVAAAVGNGDKTKIAELLSELKSENVTEIG
jgi:hypothetical protein